jgi:hypothetical protein
MRFLLAFFLSLFMTFNATYAAVTDICDFSATDRGHASVIASASADHFGHHDHDDDHASDPSANHNPSDTDTSLSHGDHCHPHQCFTSVLPDTLKLPPALGRYPSPASAADQLCSAQTPRLERPPRATLA